MQAMDIDLSPVARFPGQRASLETFEKEVVRDVRDYSSRDSVYPTAGRQIYAAAESYENSLDHAKHFGVVSHVDFSLGYYNSWPTRPTEVYAVLAASPHTQAKSPDRKFIRKLRDMFCKVVNKSDRQSLAHIFIWLRSLNALPPTGVAAELSELSMATTFMPLVARPDPREKFEKLVDEWRLETEYTSSISEACAHKAYQRIIGMGPTVLPFIFAELEREPDHWFWALSAITGDDPVPREHRGDIELMRQDWLKWARDKGY